MVRHWLDAVGWIALIAGLSHATIVCAGDAAAFPAQTYIPFKVLGQAALAAEAACADRGYTVSVTVVDRAGVKRVALVGDDAAPVATDASYRKAYTAANAGMTSAAFGRLVETPGIGPVLGLDPLLITFGGGVPIRLGERVVGGIGVAGAPSAEADEACALAGLAQLARQPK
jgi:uncharacterized protein GlcG (DUF336 family)